MYMTKFRLGLIGFPSSGKTSYLYALRWTDRERASREGWIMEQPTPEFAAKVGDVGENIIANPDGYFDQLELCVVEGRHQLRPTVRRRLVLNECAGELVQRLAGVGATTTDEQSKRLQDFLDGSDGCLALVSVSKDGRREVAECVASLATILQHCGPTFGRSTNNPLPVTILLTKFDTVYGRPDQEVTLPEKDSSLAGLAAAIGLDGQELAASGGGFVRYDVLSILNRLEGLSRCRADPELFFKAQEAVAFDYLKAHHPAAAQRVAEILKNEGIIARVLPCSPLGGETVNSSGAAVRPSVERLRERSRMVWQSLEDTLERWHEVHARRIWRRGAQWGIVVATLLLTLGIAREFTGFRYLTPWRLVETWLERQPYMLDMAISGADPARAAEILHSLLSKARDELATGQVDVIPAYRLLESWHERYGADFKPSIPALTSAIEEIKDLRLRRAAIEDWDLQWIETGAASGRGVWLSRMPLEASRPELKALGYRRINDGEAARYSLSKGFPDHSVAPFVLWRDLASLDDGKGVLRLPSFAELRFAYRRPGFESSPIFPGGNYCLDASGSPVVKITRRDKPDERTGEWDFLPSYRATSESEWKASVGSENPAKIRPAMDAASASLDSVLRQLETLSQPGTGK